MPESPQVIVITPTLGRSRWLDQSVRSVADRQRDGLALTHVLVAPANRVATLVRDYPAVTVVPEEAEGGGLYEAVNYGVRHADAWDWMTYLNDDDVLLPGFNQAVDEGKQSGADVIYGRVTYIDADGRTMGAFPVEPCSRRFASLMTAGLPPFTQQGTLVRRDCFEKLAGFSSEYRLAADHDFWVRAVVAGATFHHLPTQVGSFRLRAGQLSADQEKVQAEVAAITSRYLPEQTQWSRFVVRAGFRLRHGPAILARRLRTGHWRTVGSVGGDQA